MSFVEDAIQVGYVGVLGAISWLPEAAWRPATAALARVQTHGARPVPVPAEAGLPEDAGALRRQRRQQLSLERLPALRMYRPGGWRPRMVVEGEGRLAEALTAGRGAVLWVAEMEQATTVAKMALAGRGYRVHHMSRTSHGFGPSRLAMRRLNPLRTRMEDRFLAERILLPRGGEVAAMRRCREVLAAGGIVSVTMGSWAVQTVRARFFGGELALATGPASLARSSGAPVLPVLVGREGDGRFRVVIGQAIVAPPGGSRDAVARAVAADGARQLEAWVREYPGQWTGWHASAWRSGGAGE